MPDHNAANLVSATPKAFRPWVRTPLHSVYDQPDTEAVDAELARISDTLEATLDRDSPHLEEARADVLTFTPFPKELWRHIWSNNSHESVNREIRHRVGVVGILADENSPTRLLGAVGAEQHDERLCVAATLASKSSPEPAPSASSTTRNR